MKILIVGANGMLGHDLFQRFENSSYDVYGIDHFDLDITHSKGVNDRILRENPDWVILTAAFTRVDDCEKQRDLAWSVNALGALNVASACRATSSVLCFISTDYIFDGNKGEPYSELDKPNPVNYYAETKLAGEHFIRKTLDEYLIIRTSWLFGNCGRNFVDTILEKSRNQSVLKVVDDQTGAPTYTRDLADGIIRLIDNAARGIVNVTGKGFCSWFEFAGEILSVAKVSGVKVLPVSSNSLRLPAKRPGDSRLDLGKFTEITGIRMRFWREALVEYLSGCLEEIR